MNADEAKRLREAGERARLAPLAEHVEFRWKDADTYECCVKCGRIKPRTGWVRECRGWSKVTLRGEETPRG